MCILSLERPWRREMLYQWSVAVKVASSARVRHSCNRTTLLSNLRKLDCSSSICSGEPQEPSDEGPDLEDADNSKEPSAIDSDLEDAAMGEKSSRERSLLYLEGMPTLRLCREAEAAVALCTARKLLSAACSLLVGRGLAEADATGSECDLLEGEGLLSVCSALSENMLLLLLPLLLSLCSSTEDTGSATLPTSP